MTDQLRAEAERLYYTAHIDDIEAALRKARNDALDEAANLRLLLDIQDPGTGPFTRESRTLAQYRNAILDLKTKDPSHERRQPPQKGCRPFPPKEAKRSISAN